MQTITQAQVDLQGTGLHSGLPCSIRILRREGAGGPRFFWLGRNQPIHPDDLADFSRSALRSTNLQLRDLEIRTAEHLLAAALFFSDCPLDIHCDSQEPPGLDGSALPFFRAFAELCPDKSGFPAWCEYPSHLNFDYEGPEGRLRVEPGPSFSVEYELDRPPLRLNYILADAETAVREILPARTFIFLGEWQSAKNNGLLQGAGPGSGLLYAQSEEEFHDAMRHPGLEGKAFPLLHPVKERVDCEPVKHKILDLLGDLALLGLALPRLRIRIRNGGHALNHLLLERLHERKPSDL